jgi:transcriptional regulator GlxA family with amidase domain
MRRRTFVLAFGTAAAFIIGSLPALLRSRSEPTTSPAPEPVLHSEHQRTVEALRPPKRPRPSIVILALHEGTEVSDFLNAYGVLMEAGVADVNVVSERSEPIRLYPSVQVDAQATFAEYDASHPEGADFVVVPALEPRDNPAVLAWIRAQHGKGAKIVSICNGSLTLAAAGLLAGRRATGHWYSVDQLQAEQPSMTFVRDRRYVVDQGVATSTGITAAIPLMITLVEAIGGHAAAAAVAARLGVADWDARHNSSAFRLTGEHRKTFVRNRLTFWRHETVGIKLEAGVDEIALGLMADAYSRTELTRMITVGESGDSVRSRRGLRLRPDTSVAAESLDMVIQPPRDAPARAIDRELARIASRYDRPTAALVALTMEYPWSA